MPYKLSVVGPLRLLDGEGYDITPSSVKVRGLLALLALSKNNLASRAWLQSKLWSEQTNEQASHSLRQTLWKLNSLVQGNARFTKSNRSEVQLDLDKIKVCFGSSFSDSENNEQETLFFGLDAGDPEFDDWLRQQRANHVAEYRKPREQANFVIFLRSDVSPDPIAKIYSQTIQNELFGSLRDLGGVSIFGEDGSHGAPRSSGNCYAMSLNLFVAKLDTRAFLSCEVRETGTGAKLAFETKGFSLLESSESAQIQVFEFARRIYDQVTMQLSKRQNSEIGTDRTCAELSALAVRSIFRLGEGDLNNADILLKRAYEARPRGQFLAWRAFLRDLGFFQYRSDRHLDDRTPQANLCAEALRISPESTTVRIVTAHYRYLRQSRTSEALSIAEECVEKEGSNPLAWAVLSNILAVEGLHDESCRAAARAVRLSQNGRSSYFFHHFACMAAVSNGSYDEALAHANQSLELMPGFASPLRYKIVLDKVLGNDLEHYEAVDCLRDLEEDFSVGRLLEPDYPVNTLRRLPLIEAIA